MRGARLLLAVSSSLALVSTPVSPGAVSASIDVQSCVIARNKAAAAAFFCAARRENKLLAGAQADLATCSRSLSHRFAESDVTGLCPVGDDSDDASVQQRVDDAEANVLDALHASLAVTDQEKECVIRKNKAAAKYVLCIAAAVRKGGAVNCGGAALLEPEVRGGCLTTGDAETIAALASSAATNLVGADLSDLTWQMFYYPVTPGAGANFVLKPANLPGANLAFTNLSGADLSLTELPNADLTSADLTNTALGRVNLTNANLTDANLTDTALIGANLTNADFTGANVDNVIWINNSETTICPDGTDITSASTPPSCCVHMNGREPSSCSP